MCERRMFPAHMDGVRHVIIVCKVCSALEDTFFHSLQLLSLKSYSISIHSLAATLELGWTMKICPAVKISLYCDIEVANSPKVKIKKRSFTVWELCSLRDGAFSSWTSAAGWETQEAGAPSPPASEAGRPDGSNSAPSGSARSGSAAAGSKGRNHMEGTYFSGLHLKLCRHYIFDR